MNARVSRLSDSSRSVLAGPDDRHQDPALVYLEPPPVLGRVAWAVAGAFLLLALVLPLVPWRQSALATGRVVAYAPADRQQVVQAPVKGRLGEWYVGEGDVVSKGEVLVEITDNDPSLVRRLTAQADALDAERSAVEDQIRSYEAKISALRASAELVTAEYAGKVAALHQERVEEAAALDADQRQLERVQTLAAEGIASVRDRELAEMKQRGSVARVQAVDASVRAARAAGVKARQEVESKIASAEAELEAARGKLAKVERDQLELETVRTRQDAQTVRAPRDGVVLRVHGGPGGEQVTSGDALVTLVPDTRSRAVELWVDGNDMPLVREGETVRLVFEGWPALQVVGLPGASEGTFPGVVDFVDATDDGSGQFRVLVVPESEDAWPDPTILRQGVRTKGWFLLGQVSVGYELWRQLNGFPALPDVEKGRTPLLPSSKKPRAPVSLK